MKEKISIKQTKSGAVSAHAKFGEGDHVVGLGNIRVLICQDGDAWFAQGLEIDYSAQGETKEEVEKIFQDGIIRTVELHLKTYKHINHFLTPAPPSVWKELVANSESYRYDSVTKHEIHESLPYSGFDFFIRPGALAFCG